MTQFFTKYDYHIVKGVLPKCLIGHIIKSAVVVTEIRLLPITVTSISAVMTNSSTILVSVILVSYHISKKK